MLCSSQMLSPSRRTHISRSRSGSPVASALRIGSLSEVTGVPSVCNSRPPSLNGRRRPITAAGSTSSSQPAMRLQFRHHALGVDHEHALLERIDELAGATLAVDQSLLAPRLLEVLGELARRPARARRARPAPGPVASGVANASSPSVRSATDSGIANRLFSPARSASSGASRASGVGTQTAPPTAQTWPSGPSPGAIGVLLRSRARLASVG